MVGQAPVPQVHGGKQVFRVQVVGGGAHPALAAGDSQCVPLQGEGLLQVDDLRPAHRLPEHAPLRPGKAIALGVTRAYLSMKKASEIKGPVIFAIGNAPTALVSLYEMMRDGVYSPAFIIGVPVGFVNVEASKELIMNSDVPYIVNEGRKGGSNVAAAICNAILYSLDDKR